MMTTALYHFIAPVSGKCVPVEAVHSNYLGKKLLGEGVTIFPIENVVTAPCDGVITRVSQSAHSLTFLDTRHNLEILMQTNVHAAEADVTICVKPGEVAKAGTPLFTCDVETVHSCGGEVEVSCIVTNIPPIDVNVKCGDVISRQSRILSCECAC